MRRHFWTIFVCIALHLLVAVCHIELIETDIAWFNSHQTVLLKSRWQLHRHLRSLHACAREKLFSSNINQEHALKCYLNQPPHQPPRTFLCRFVRNSTPNPFTPHKTFHEAFYIEIRTHFTVEHDFVISLYSSSPYWRDKQLKTLTWHTN